MAATISFGYSIIEFALSIAKVISNGTIRGGIRGILSSTMSEKACLVSQGLGDVAFANPYAYILLEIQDTLKSPLAESKTMKKASMISISIITFSISVVAVSGMPLLEIKFQAIYSLDSKSHFGKSILPTLALFFTSWEHISAGGSYHTLTTRCRVKCNKAENYSNRENLTQEDEQTLQKDLETAIKEEDYHTVAKIRDRVRLLHEDSKSSILAENSRFHNAFRNRDLAAMQSIWNKGEDVYVIHPGAGRISGYDLVMGSWEIVCGAEHEFSIKIDLEDVIVHVKGDIGYVTCMEVLKSKG